MNENEILEESKKELSKTFTIIDVGYDIEKMIDRKLNEDKSCLEIINKIFEDLEEIKLKFETLKNRFEENNL